MKDKFEEHACEFVNEAVCEEELNEIGLNREEEESKHFNDSQW